MVGTTSVDHKEDDSLNQWSPNVLAKAKMKKAICREELEKKTLVEWEDRGMKISSVLEEKLKFCIHIIVHKIYNSRK